VVDLEVVVRSSNLEVCPGNHEDERFSGELLCIKQQKVRLLRSLADSVKTVVSFFIS